MKNIDEAKKICYKRIKKYTIYWLPILFLQFSLLLITLFLKKDLGKYLGIIFTVFNILVFITFLIILDGGPTLKIKKNNFKIENKKYEKSKIIIFYNSLKLITFLRGLINFVSILLIIGTSALFFV